MNTIFQIVRKDLLNLKFPLALWVLIILGRLGLYAMASGLVGEPKLEWLGYLQEGPLLVLRVVLDPLIVYFLAGSFVFEDPLVELDAFWITRPISGGRLLGAKLLGACLMFIILPVMLTLPWWLACGLGFRDVAVAAVLLILPIISVAIVGIACAAITDGFPRYLLWTLAGIAAAAVIQFLVAMTIGGGSPAFGVGATRVGIGLASLGLVSLAVIIHQYLTRNLRRSIVILVTGMIISSVAAILSSLDLTKKLEGSAVAEQAGDDKIQIKMAGRAHFDAGTHPPGIWIPIVVEGVPEDANRWVTLQGKWSWKDTAGWRGFGGQWNNDPTLLAGMRRTLGLSLKDSFAPIEIGMPMSQVLAERMTREPANFHGEAEIHIQRGLVEAEMRPRDETTRNALGSFTISATRRMGGVLSLEFTFRKLVLDRRFIYWSPIGGFIMFRSADGSVAPLEYRSMAGSFAVLDSVLVVTGQLKFKSPAGSGWFDDAAIALISFGEGRIIKRTLDADPFELSGTVASPVLSGPKVTP